MGRTVEQRRSAEAAEHTKRLKSAARVHRMRMAGHSYAEIAEALGMDNTSQVARLHTEHIDQLRELEALGAADAARRVQDDRYEALLGSVWADAMNGDLAAVRECRTILDSITSREVKVTALVTKDTDEGRVSLVAEGATQDYVDALRRMGE